MNRDVMKPAESLRLGYSSNGLVLIRSQVDLLIPELHEPGFAGRAKKRLRVVRHDESPLD